MRYLFALFVALLMLSLPVLAQNTTAEAPEGIFVDLTSHDGWGPFLPRDGFKAQFQTGAFTLAGQKYRVYLLRDPEDPRREQRILLNKSDSETLNSEKEGLPIYYNGEYVSLEGFDYEIYGYSEKADQFVLFKKEDVNYVQRGLEKGTNAPEFELTDLNSGTISLRDFRGQYVLLDFWGTWCGPCLRETPHLKSAHEQFGDRVAFIGIAVDYDRQRVIDYLDKNDIQWPQIFVPKNWDNPPSIITQYNVFGYPSIYLIDTEGNVLIGPEKQTRLRGKRLSETLEKITSAN